MKKIIAGVILPMLIISFTCLTSCKDKATRKQQKKVEMEQVKTIENQIEANVYPLPTSAAVIKMLTELEVGYIIGISNPVENTKKYFSSTTRAINLGVYGADLSYATLYNTYSYLSENDQQPLALLVVGGAWVEGMFLTTHVSEAAYQVAGISRVLLEQKKSFELFLEITKPYATDPSVSDFVKLLDPVKKVYEGLGTSLTEQNIKDITKVIGG